MFSQENKLFSYLFSSVNEQAKEKCPKNIYMYNLAKHYELGSEVRVQGWWGQDGQGVRVGGWEGDNEPRMPPIELVFPTSNN